MKRYIFIVILCSLCFVYSKAQDRIMVIADPHVYPQALIAQDTATFNAYMKGQRKMVDLSEPIWHALIDTALAKQPSLVLIPGDLTRDGENESHAIVKAGLDTLRAHGIRTLVIPGNHDLPDANWESLYFGANDVYMKDPNSHSYATQPLQGLTVIGIDGSDGNAGTGKLSPSTLAWILARADEAVAQGRTIIAMAHWQILEHFDKQGELESSCRLANADAIRDSLMTHGIHLVLTGHFHVNGGTTYRNEQTLDSLVEITTGSPITYPCPYRWLTFSEDKSTMTVQTDFLMAVDTIADLYTYSRNWMTEHAQNMIPALALRAWNKVENNWDKVESALSKIFMGWMSEHLYAALPQTDEEKIDLVQRHFGNAAINLYLFHSEANEFERPEMGQAMADSLYNGMDGMMGEVFADYIEMIPVFKVLAKSMAEEPVQSLVEDKTQWKSKLYADVTDDLHPTLVINAPQIFTGIENQQSNINYRKFLQNGQLYIQVGNILYTIDGRVVR